MELRTSAVGLAEYKIR